MTGENAAKLGKSACGIPVLPSAPLFKRLGQVPVVQRDMRRNALSKACADHALVKLQPLRIDLAVAFWQDSAPGDAETVVLERYRPFGR